MTTQPLAIDVLKQYAHQLQLAAPKEWDTFLQVFDAYTHEVVMAMADAPSEQILGAQGRANAYIWLLRHFRTCHQKTPQQPPTA